MSDKNLSFGIRPTVDHKSLPDPLAANYVGLSRFADDFVLSVGWMNIPVLVEELKKINKEGAEIAVTPKITHQFFMTKTGFLQLYRQARNFAVQLEKQGLLTSTEIEWVPDNEAAPKGKGE